MKKVFSMVAVLIFAIAFSSQAQYKMTLKSVYVSSVKATEGANTVIVPDGNGTLTFVKRASAFSNVVFIDAAGKRTSLTPTAGGTSGAPQPECKTTLRDACFGTANKNIGMCICKPANIAGAPETYSISLLLPAVQKVREAATRH